MKNFAILTGALALAACGGSKEDTTTIETKDGKVQLSVDGNGEGGNYKITTKDGEMTAQMGGAANIPLPTGYSLYPGANVVSRAAIKTAEGNAIHLVMETADSPDKVVDFYRKQATAAGVTIDSEMNAGGMQVITGKNKAGLEFSLNVLPGDGGKSTAMLNLGQGSGS